MQGCHGGIADSLSLTVAADGSGRVEGTVEEWDESSQDFVSRVVKRALSKDGATKAVQQLSSAVARLERPSGCESTVRTFARLAWSCGESPPQTLEYKTYDCGPRLLDGVASETRSGQQARDGYSRAIALRTIAGELLKPPAPE